MNTNNTSKKGVKILGGIILTVLLGAIGSGIWERILSKYTDSILNWLIYLFSSISSGYLDYIYREVGNGNVEIFSRNVYLTLKSVWVTFFLLSILFTCYIIPKMIKWVDENKVDKDSEDKETIVSFDKLPLRLFKNKASRFLIGVFLLILLTVEISELVKDAKTFRTVQKVEKALDIIAPMISDQSLKELRSEFRQVDSYKKYVELKVKLLELSSKHGIELLDLKNE